MWWSSPKPPPLTESVVAVVVDGSCCDGAKSPVPDPILQNLPTIAPHPRSDWEVAAVDGDAREACYQASSYVRDVRQGRLDDAL